MLYRQTLAAAFAVEKRYRPVVAWDLSSLVLALESAKPVVTLVNMASRGGHLLLRVASELNPDGEVIALGAAEDDEAGIVACAEGGAAGYHMKTDSLDQLFELIDTVEAGRSGCPPRVAAILLRQVSALAAQSKPAEAEPIITAREAQILRMLELGLSNRDIAAHLSIAVHTVKNHVHSLLTKLGVSTRTEAAALSRAIRTGRGTTTRSRPRSNQN